MGKLDLPQVPLKKIYLDPKDRLRKRENGSYGDLMAFAKRISLDGQLQPILVRPFLKEEHPDVKEKYDWVVWDGGRRYLAIEAIYKVGGTVPNLKPGNIGAVLKSEADHSNKAYLWKIEFQANEEREDFSWKEKAAYVRKSHEWLVAHHEKWTIDSTAAFVGMSRVGVLRYLQLTEDEDIFLSKAVQGSDSFRSAYKKATIEREKKKRKAVVTRQQEVEESMGVSLVTHLEAAKEMCYYGDCRDWIKEKPDEYFSWFHWDPPYGGEQDGGSSRTFEEIDDSAAYAQLLHEQMLPEIFRTLRPGGWLALWFHPQFYAEVVGLLEEVGFWVNPYPNIWYKRDRQADGHEITKYLVNAYECFLLAGKPVPKEKDESEVERRLILPLSNRQNVFVHDVIPKAERRHIMHKPAGVLQKIVSIISVPGELGGDGGSGGGSIIEATFAAGRKVEVAEIIEGYYLTSVEVAAKALSERGATKELKPKSEEVEELPDEISI